MNGRNSLQQRWVSVLERIARAEHAAQRMPGSVTLLAVSKTFDAAAVAELAALGQRRFGENYVQEGVAKIETLKALGTAQAPLEWHFIGPIQSNKTRPIAETFDWVHSIERERIARRLNDQRPPDLPALQVLVQVNVSGEQSKSGCAPEDVPALVKAIATMPRLRLRGLMAIPEPSQDPEVLRERFACLRRLLEAISHVHPEADTLSMGMSADLEVAIAEGATLVRVGSALFGARPSAGLAPS